jgi:surface antigen
MSKSPMTGSAAAACLLSVMVGTVGMIGTARAAEPLNIKPGQWEMSTVTGMNGAMMPTEMLARMSPEQRARIEATLKAHGVGPGAHPNTTKTCVTREDLLRGSVRAEKEQDKNCQYRVLSQTSTRMETHFHCSGDPVRDGEMKFEAVTPENLQGAIQVTTPQGKVNITLTGRWLGAACNSKQD